MNLVSQIATFLWVFFSFILVLSGRIQTDQYLSLFFCGAGKNSIGPEQVSSGHSAALDICSHAPPGVDIKHCSRKIIPSIVHADARVPGGNLPTHWERKQSPFRKITGCDSDLEPSCCKTTVQTAPPCGLREEEWEIMNAIFNPTPENK